MNNSLQFALENLLAQYQVKLYGVVDVAGYRGRYPELGWPLPDNLPAAVVIAYPLLAGVLDTIADRPTHLYFHHYRQVNWHLDRLALAVGHLFESEGFKALPIGASQTLDSGDLTAHMSHCHMGYLAGLGWRGKNNLLVNELYGSRFRMVTVLTTAPLDTGEQLEKSLCRECRLCMKACPAGAIGETPEDFEFDKCYAMIREHRKIPRIGQHICGVCQRACSRFTHTKGKESL